MTFVSILTTPDRAEIVVDSLLVPEDPALPILVDRGRKIDTTAGVRSFLTSSGLVDDGHRWHAHANEVSLSTRSFEDLVANLDAESCATQAAVFYAVGQDSTGGFKAYAWAPWTGWKPLDVSGWHLQPHPDGLQRGDALLDLQLAHALANDNALANLELPDGPPRPHPSTLKDWRIAVHAVRQTRAVRPRDGALFNAMGGIVTRTTVTADSVRVDLVTVLDAPDLPDSEDFLRMVDMLRRSKWSPCARHLKELRRAITADADCEELHAIAGRIDKKSPERRVANELLRTIGCHYLTRATHTHASPTTAR